MSQEMVKEKQRYTTLEKRTKEKVETQQAEIHALHARMQQSHDQHMAEVNALKIRLAEMDAQRGGAGSQDLIIRMKEVRTIRYYCITGIFYRHLIFTIFLRYP